MVRAVQIHFELAGPDGSVLAAGDGACIPKIDLTAWGNCVTHVLHAAGVVCQPGHRINLSVGIDQPISILPKEMLERAVESFYRAVGPYLDAVGAVGSVCSREDDVIDGSVTEVVEALLYGGWTSPLEDGDQAEEIEPTRHARRAVSGEHGVMTLRWSRGERRG